MEASIRSNEKPAYFVLNKLEYALRANYNASDGLIKKTYEEDRSHSLDSFLQ